MKNKRFIIVGGVVALFNITALASPVAISCKVLDLATGKVETTFVRGEKVAIVVGAKYNNAAAAHQKVSLSVVASATVNGIKIPFEVMDTNTFANTNPDIAGDPEWLQSGTAYRILKVPKLLPPTTATITAAVSIANVGKATCTDTIKIVK